MSNFNFEQKFSPPPSIRFKLYFGMSIFIMCIVLLVFIKIDEVVVAEGVTVSLNPKIIVQPYKKSIVRRIYVSPGDFVNSKQSLVDLDHFDTSVDINYLNSRLNQINANIQRINAELQGKEFGSPHNEEELLQKKTFSHENAYYLENINKEKNLINSLSIKSVSIENQIKIYTQQLSDEKKLKKCMKN